MFSSEYGIFIGEYMGLGLFSFLDPADQPAAVTFSSIDEAKKYMSTWHTDPPSDIYFFPVNADLENERGKFISREALKNHNFPVWSIPQDYKEERK